MNVAFLAKTVSAKRGGLPVIVHELVTRLSNFRDMQLSVFAVREPEDQREGKVWPGVNLNLYNHFGPHALGYSPRLVDDLKELNPDILHTHGLFHYTSMASIAWRKRNGGIHLVSPHGMLDPWALRNSRWKKVMASLAFEKKHLKGSSFIHALNSEETRAIRLFGLKNPIMQIPNGIDLPERMKGSRPPWHGWVANGRKVLLFLGRLHPKKNLLNLLTAWAEVGNKKSEWLLVVSGIDENSYERTLVNVARERGLGETVFFGGPQFGESKASCFENADAFILPSLSEGLPVVILEAWAHRLPVMMTRQCNLPEGFERGAAMEVRPSVRELKNGLEDFFSLDDSERRSMGHAGYNLVLEKFTWERVVDEYHKMYAWLLGEGEVPGNVVWN